MNTFWKLIEKILTSLLISFLLAMASFSFFTGKFPPRKADMVRAYQLFTSLMKSGSSVNALGEEVQQTQAQGGLPNLGQMAEFQRLSLQRTEISMELLALFPKIQMGAANPEIGDRLQKVSQHMDAVEKEMAEIAVQLQKTLEPGAGSQ